MSCQEPCKPLIPVPSLSSRFTFRLNSSYGFQEASEKLREKLLRGWNKSQGSNFQWPLGSLQLADASHQWHDFQHGLPLWDHAHDVATTGWSWEELAPCVQMPLPDGLPHQERLQERCSVLQRGVVQPSNAKRFPTHRRSWKRPR